MSVITPRYQPDYVVHPSALSIEDAARAWENLQNNFQVLFEDLATLADNIYFIDGDTPVSMADGGTGASLTADLGEVVYSGASALALTSTAGVAHAGWFLQLGTVYTGPAPTPIWSNDLLTSATIGSAYIYRVGGTDVSVADGGTGFSSYTIGDILTADTTTSLKKITAVATGSVFLSQGIAAQPAWGSDLPTALTIGGAYIYRVGGTDVAVADGGTGLSSYAVGDLLYASATTTIGKLADVAVNYVLVSGGVGVAPAWSTTPTVTSLTLTSTGTALTMGNGSGIANVQVSMIFDQSGNQLSFYRSLLTSPYLMCQMSTSGLEWGGGTAIADSSRVLTDI